MRDTPDDNERIIDGHELRKLVPLHRSHLARTRGGGCISTAYPVRPIKGRVVA